MLGLVGPGSIILQNVEVYTDGLGIWGTDPKFSKAQQTKTPNSNIIWG